MGCWKEAVLEVLPDAQCGDENARLGLLALGLDRNQESVSENLSTAAGYRLRGLSVVPQMPGAKQPCIRWKEFQDRLPAADELEAWWRSWPDAGIAAVLGPTSGLFAIDVDGPEAHKALVQRLGDVPKAPKSISGSGKPYRYHLFFQHPDSATNAKFAPWCPTLEFRGQGGIVVLPPSRHKSGKCYQWAKGLSIYEIDLPTVPTPILAELANRGHHRSCRHARAVGATRQSFTPGAALGAGHLKTLSNETRLFLCGEYANGPDWNCRLFVAACDLAGSGVNESTATRMLLAGAQPWNSDETDRALTTIRSAYSEPRHPARQKRRRTRRAGSQTSRQGG